jgi:precorrin-6B C5,15-methyltransferase / cobalt-precorrin-6B C5,C15-methyltransferase
MSDAPHITVIGCDGAAPQEGAAAALAAARCVVGARRNLDSVKPPPGAEQIELRDVDAALRKACARPGPVAVLASGDPGFFGIVRLLRARGVRPRVIPAVSSVALAFARLGLPWDDAVVLSAHGREPRRVLAAALGCAKSAILTAPGREAGPQRFLPALLAAGREVHVAECLGTPGERVTMVTVASERGPFADPNIVVSVDPGSVDPGPVAPGSAAPRPGYPPGEPGWIAGHRGAPPAWALPEDAFGHRNSMITKAEVRAFVLARLGPGPGRTIWDVGAGSGSVAVECARFGAHVVAVEHDPGQCGHIRGNAAAHGVRLRVVAGPAPAALEGLPPADAVFCGGGKDDVIAAVARHRPPRIVVALASVDRVRTVRDLITANGYRFDGTQLQASRMAGMPGGSVRLTGGNPVFVLWGELP